MFKVSPFFAPIHCSVNNALINATPLFNSISRSYTECD